MVPHVTKQTRRDWSLHATTPLKGVGAALHDLQRYARNPTLYLIPQQSDCREILNREKVNVVFGPTLHPAPPTGLEQLASY